MDYKRFSLISGLAIVSYMLLLAWNDDYPRQTAQPSEPTTELVADIPLNTDRGDFPTSLPVSPNLGSLEDIPQVENPTAPALPAVTDNIAGLITVSTPVHIITIDLNGGDIVAVSLPEYPTSLETPDDPFVLLQNNANGVYVAQSGLVGTNGPDASESGRPLYKSAQDSYVLSENGGQLSVDLNYTDARGVSITKRFTFSADDYLINMQFLINNQSESSWSANLFGQIKRDGSPDPSNLGRVGMRTYLGAALYTDDDHYKRIDFGDIDDGSSTDEVAGGWIVFSQHYFLAGWIPDSETINTYTTRKNSAGEYILGFVSPAVMVPAGTSRTFNAGFYAGPKDQYRLKEISPYLELTIDYGWLWFLASPIFWLLTQINNLVGNFGFSIILLTIVIKLLFSKLSATSYRSMANMRRLAPKIAQIKDRYSDDKQKIMQAQMALWKKEKVNPMGGCLPMLIQMPVLLGIYWVLNESVELRHASFILWYKDLSVMDPYFILPIVMGISMFVSQSLSPMTTADPMQAKVMKFMPVIFTVFFLWFPAGLVLYWLVGNIFNIIQQQYINRKVEAFHKARTS